VVGGGGGGGGGGGVDGVYVSGSSQSTVNVDSKSDDALFGRNVRYVLVTMRDRVFSPIFFIKP